MADVPEGALVSDRRRAPFCYQTHDALDAIRERYTGKGRSTALAIYLTLTEIANRSGGEAARGGFEAGRKEIAAEAGVGLDTLDRYTKDFEEIGILSVEKRKIGAVNLPNVWVLTEPEQAASAPPSRKPGVRGSRKPGVHRARSFSEAKKQTEEKELSTAAPQNGSGEGLASPVIADPPPLVRVGGRDLALDALAEVTGLQPGEPAYGSAVTALKGRNLTKGGSTPEPGIADLAWQELGDWCKQHATISGLSRLSQLHEHPEQWQLLLVQMIRAKAAKYHETMHGAFLTPKALRDWWLRLGHMDVITGGGATEDAIRGLKL